MPCDSSHGFRNYPIHSYINPVSMPKMMGRGECICFGVLPRRNALKRARRGFIFFVDPTAGVSSRQAGTGCRGGDALRRDGKGNKLVRV